MSETKSVCPSCKIQAHVSFAQGAKIKMECPQCKKHWWTVSMRCTGCGKPTGFAVPGLCGICYSLKKEAQNEKVYALYKGDQFVTEGTIWEIHQQTGKTLDSIKYMTYPIYEKRCGDNSNRMLMIPLDDDEGVEPCSS